MISMSYAARPLCISNFPLPYKEAPEVYVHAPYVPGLGIRSRLLSSLQQRLKKVVIFTSPSILAQQVETLARLGVLPGKGLWVLRAQDKIDLREDNIEAFKNQKEAVLIASIHLSHGWRVDADCLIFDSVSLRGDINRLQQNLARVNQPKELHFIDCAFPSTGAFTYFCPPPLMSVDLETSPLAMLPGKWHTETSFVPSPAPNLCFVGPSPQTAGTSDTSKRTS